jgi:hypothetical protein
MFTTAGLSFETSVATSGVPDSTGGVAKGAGVLGSVYDPAELLVVAASSRPARVRLQPVPEATRARDARTAENLVIVRIVNSDLFE